MPEETPQQETPQPQTAPSADSKDVEENKIMAVLAYLGILVLIPLLTKKDSPFTMYHVKQGLALLILEVIAIPVYIVLAFIPIIGWLASMALWVLILVLLILGIVNAVNGKMKELPVIGQFGKKFKF